MDSAELVQVGVSLQYPPIGPLSLWERAGVRAGNLKPALTLKPPAKNSSETAAV